MFGLIRTAILVLVAFAAGLLFERAQAGDACREAGGQLRDGICHGVPA